MKYKCKKKNVSKIFLKKTDYPVNIFVVNKKHFIVIPWTNVSK